MKVEIELFAGHRPKGEPTKADMSWEIEAVERAIVGKPSVCDAIPLIGVKYMLIRIMEQLPE